MLFHLLDVEPKSLLAETAGKISPPAVISPVVVIASI